MFEDSLLIIKSDYMHKRKPILLKLLQKDFQIQGRRRLRFTPELAAEFYKNEDGRTNFMLLVIMLSKGNAEALILARENCVEELMNTMVCYFGSSVEMERNVHVSTTMEDARREITFIFPNYIHEPLPTFSRAKFINNPLSTEILTEAYDIISGATAQSQNWKVQLAEWLALSNGALPIISNACAKKPLSDRQEQSTLATQIPDKATRPCVPPIDATTTPSTPTLALSSAGSSMMMTSSSCITCSCFDGDDTCYKHVDKQPEIAESFELYVKHKLEKSPSSISEEHVCEEQDIESFEEGVEEEMKIVEERDEEGEKVGDTVSDTVVVDGEKLEEADEEMEEVEERKLSIIDDDELPPPSEPVPDFHSDPVEVAPTPEAEEQSPPIEETEQKAIQETEDERLATEQISPSANEVSSAPPNEGEPTPETVDPAPAPLQTSTPEEAPADEERPQE